jgi:two-component system chemotaxis response regulator CheB
MLSALTSENAETVLHALDIGASDYLEKPEDISHHEAFAADLINKILSAAESAEDNVTFDHAPELGPELINIAKESTYTLSLKTVNKPRILAIGASTGGPPVLTELLRHLKPSIAHIPVVITQHIPKQFDVLLAETLSQSCKVNCTVPSNGDELVAGHVYLAPNDFHMEIIMDDDGKTPRIKLSQTEQEHFCRPSVNPMLRSIVAIYKSRALMVMLTGMGKDGIEGAIALYEAGGTILAQDKATSVVWGMPGAVANAGICADVLSKENLPARIKEILE